MLYQNRNGVDKGCSVLGNYQSLFSNFLPLAPLIISLSIKYIRNRLLLESFIELPAYVGTSPLIR